jgi:predicted Zn-dependent protease
MVDQIDDLVRAWKQDPGPATTIALCDALCANPRGALVQQVGEFAKERHASDVSVVLSVARMYIETNRLIDAQALLVAAGKRAPREGRVYRWLGEVLLRRGDAQRAEKVLSRALQLGAGDRDGKVWMERARAYGPLQASAGPSAVAAEVARLAPPYKMPAPSPPPLRLPSDPDETAKDVFARVHTGEIDVSGAAAQLPWTESTETDAPTRVEPAVPLVKRARHASNGASATAAPFELPSRRPAHAPAKKPMVPHPRDVLDALALAGVFEHRVDGSAAAWAKATRGPKRRGGPTLIAAMVLFLAGSVGIYFFYRDKRAKDHLQAEALLTTIETRLRAAKPGELADAERELGLALRLESRSPRAALDWARERAMMGLVKSGADVAFEDAMARAKEVGVPEEKFAFARVASFLFQGDTAGAAAALSRWENGAAGDEWYQLVAGATLERAGDPRARDRYATASKLDPELAAAKIALARAAAIDGDTQEAMRLARALRQAMPERAEPIALVALAWGRDARREEIPAPAEVEELPKRQAELPSGLRFVSHAIAALRALDKLDASGVRAEVQNGIAVAESPGAAVWLGAIAVTLGDEALARKAALLGLQFSAAYEPARALAARVALIGGRLDEALKATEDLDVSPDVAVVRAASAYERVDIDALMRALEALPPGARKLPLLAALDLADGALAGKLHLDPVKLLTMASDDAPWADLVAMDVALDSGDLASADKIANRWGKDAESQPLRAVRLARLARYEARLDAADTLSQTALLHGTATPRVLWERGYVLVAKGRAAEVAPLLARYPLVLGPLATWLSAYSAASGGSIDVAKARTASIDPPPRGAALETRVVAAAAFGAMKDRRRGFEYVRDTLASGSLHPDLVAAALSLGLHRVDHGRRGPTYE